jgi:putative integral membrane protein (TIGR02587 family)
MTGDVVIDWARERRYLADLGRAGAGALLFGIPLLMTMEMWEEGQALAPGRILLFLGASLPLLCGLAYYAGFSARRGLVNDVLDAATALGVGLGVAAAVLLLFGVLETAATAAGAAGMVGLQAVPGAMGALLARRQLNGEGGDTEEDDASYGGELFLMAAGALFFALNVAPTEEMVVIAYRITAVHALALAALSLILLHLIVYRVGFAGQKDAGHPVTAVFHFTLPGYALALGVSLAILFVFGRTDGHGAAEIIQAMVVLGFPASIGAAAARLLV